MSSQSADRCRANRPSPAHGSRDARLLPNVRVHLRRQRRPYSSDENRQCSKNENERIQVPAFTTHQRERPKCRPCCCAVCGGLRRRPLLMMMSDDRTGRRETPAGDGPCRRRGWGAWWFGTWLGSGCDMQRSPLSRTLFVAKLMAAIADWPSCVMRQVSKSVESLRNTVCPSHRLLSRSSHFHFPASSKSTTRSPNEKQHHILWLRPYQKPIC